MNEKRFNMIRKSIIGAAMVLFLAAFASIGLAQEIIESISPSSASPGEAITLTITMADVALPPVPPSHITPTSVKIGSLEGSDIGRSDYIITANFTIPDAESIGSKDVVVSFPGPNQEDVVFTRSNGFQVEMEGGANPRPDIKVNGSDGSLNVAPGTAAAVTISLEAGNGAGENADWWIAVATPSGLFFLDVSSGAPVLKPGLSYTFQKPLADVSAVDTLNISELSEGAHTFYFVVDMTPNGLVDEPLYYDLVEVSASSSGAAADRAYTVVDTGQDAFYDDKGATMSPPEPGEPFHGQDAQYAGAVFSFRDNGDGTITDLTTGLMWRRDPGEKMTFEEAISGVESFELAGWTDWRMPTIKELYSLIDFSGSTGFSANESIPYIDTNYFVFNYGDESAGERFIDSQYISGTRYVGATMGGNETAFGVNFADGRIKGYGFSNPGSGEDKTFFVMYVRDNADYGENAFVDNGDGTIADLASGLTWMQVDSGALSAGENGDGGLNWEQALEWAESLEYAGHSDWRLPSAKELQSIVDYTRSPSTTNSAAIDPLFASTSITDEGGGVNYPFYWTGTTHLDGANPGDAAAYIAFGEALGWMESPSGQYELMDVHGAGAQRSDPKIGDPADYPYGHGPQGDVRRIYNYVRCVRD